MATVVPTPPSPSTLFAAVDMGTNSFKLHIVRADPTGKFLILHCHREPVVLGRDNASGTISFQSRKRALDALRKFSDTLDLYKIERSHTRFVATSAVREAANREEFCESVREALGCEVNVLSGEDEARFIYLGVLQFLPVFEKLLLTVDIGGGSTEFVIGREGRVLFGTSLKLGHVTLTQMFMNDGEIDVMRMREYIRKLVQESGVIERVKECGIEMVVGSSGTIRAIEKAVFHDYGRGLIDNERLLRKCGRDWRFSRAELRSIVERLCCGGGEEKIRRDRFFDKRSEFIVAGGVLLEEIFELLGIEEMEVSEYALGVGVISETLASVYDGYNLNANIRWQSVMRLATRFNSKKRMNFAVECAGIAKELFEGIKNSSELAENQIELASSLDRNDLECLEAACLLHSIGLFFGKSGYHKQSYGIIMNGGHLPGYNDEEVKLIALLARYHRKKIPKFNCAPFKQFSEEVRQKFKILCAIIRVSVALQQFRCVNSGSVELLNFCGDLKLVLNEANGQVPLHNHVHPLEGDADAALREQLEYFNMVLNRDS